jgi:DNA polymerase-3 subunit delta
MTAIKPQALEAFLRRPDPGIIAVLIYGEDGEAVRELAERTVGKMSGSSVDPFNVASLSEADLAADPARLADEAQSISMFGGSRVIWVRGAGDAFLKSVTPLLQQETAGNLIVAEAGILAKSSRLRMAMLR